MKSNYINIAVGKCLVTGRADIIGVKIVQKLLKMGYEVTVADNLGNSDGKLLNKMNCEFIKQDTSDVRVVELFSNYSFMMKTKPTSMYACTKTFLENMSDTVNIGGLNIAGLRIFTG